MAITNLISGELKNKVGSMVGAKWKGKAYVRAYVVPKNPKTVAQVAVRSKFKTLTLMGSAINEGILKPYQAKAVKNMSPFNRFVNINKQYVDKASPTFEDINIFNGSLPNITGSATLVATSAVLATVNFTPALYGIAKADDTMVVAVYNSTLDVWGTGTVARGDGTAKAVAIDIPSSSGDVLYAWVSSSQMGTANGNTATATLTVA